jgi:hypothetical protein
LLGVHVAPYVGDDALERRAHYVQTSNLLRKLGMLAVAADHPLDLASASGALAAAGESLAVAEARYRAGKTFGRLWWSRYRPPVARAVDLGANTGARAAPLRDDGLTPAERDERDAAKFRAMDAALSRCGRHVRAVVIRVVCALEPPRPAQLAALRRGLDAIRNARVEPVIAELKRPPLKRPQPDDLKHLQWGTASHA